MPRGAAASRTVALIAALALSSAAAARAQTVPLPGNAASGSSEDALIWQVACPAAGGCVGVGAYHDTSAITTPGGTDQALIETEAGGVWHGADVSAIPGAGSSPVPYLSTVACSSPGECVAADAYDDAGGNEQGLLDVEAGGSWNPIEAPLLGVEPVATNPGVEVYDMSCPAAGSCVGVGTYVTGVGDTEGLIETQAGSSWSASAAPVPGDAAASPDPIFYDLSCASAGSCAAVGYYTDGLTHQQGLLETDSGGSWSATRLDLSHLSLVPASDPQASVSGVSCAAAGECAAVGIYEDSAGAFVPFEVEEADGIWLPAAPLSLPADSSVTPDAAGDPLQNDLFLNGIACASPGDCTAVGSYDATSANYVEPLSITESGGVWGAGVVTTLPAGADAAAANPAGALDSVSCQAPGACLAAGTYRAAGGDNIALIARESDGAWTTAGADLASAYDAGLANQYWASVACAPAGYCAVGGYVADALSGLDDPFMLEAPGGPATATATAVGTQATVDWSAPQDDGGLPVTGYSLQAEDLSDPGRGGQSAQLPASATSATLAGLTPGDSYTFTVTAESLLGVGLPATTAAVSPPAAQPSPPAQGTATAPASSATIANPAPVTASAEGAVSRSRLAASLATVLRPHGPAATIARLRRTRRYTFSYAAIARGRLSIRWYCELTRAHRRRVRVLFAAGSATRGAPGALGLTVRLTRSGLRLIGVGGAHGLQLTAVVSVASGAMTVRRTVVFRLGLAGRAGR